MKYLFPGHEQEVLKSFSPYFKSRDVISSFLPGCNFELLYRASEHGWSSADFHHRCNSQGPTITILTSKEGYIFGGYAQESWISSGHTQDANAFIFLVKGHEDFVPVKLQLVPGQEHHAIWDHANEGHSFGSFNDLLGASTADALEDAYYCGPLPKNQMNSPIL